MSSIKSKKFEIISISLFVMLNIAMILIIHYFLKSTNNNYFVEIVADGKITFEELSIELIHVLIIFLLPTLSSIIVYQHFHKKVFITFLLVNLVVNFFAFFTIVSIDYSRYAVIVFDFSFFFILGLFIISNYRINQNLKKIREETENAQLIMMRTAQNIMLSQMKPHFMYNTLNTIKYLITEDPEKAEFAIVKFSDYLRANMNSLNKDGFILFTEELKHIDNYVSIEQLRFGDRVKVHYNIECEDFFLPCLCVQPLVENAIKHGITQKISGGNVWVSTKKEKDMFVIEVKDDGVGFETSKLQAESSSLALKNIKERLSIIPHASFEVVSKKDSGTTCIIKLSASIPSYLL